MASQRKVRSKLQSKLIREALLLLPLDSIFECLFDKANTFEDISYIVYPPLLDLLGKGDVSFQKTEENEAKIGRNNHLQRF